MSAAISSSMITISTRDLEKLAGVSEAVTLYIWLLTYEALGGGVVSIDKLTTDTGLSASNIEWAFKYLAQQGLWGTE